MKRIQSAYAVALQDAPSTSERLTLAIADHHAGRFAEAAAAYQSILADDPGQPGALHYLGLLAFQIGQTDAAISLLSQARIANPFDAEVCANLGNCLLATGRILESVDALRAASVIAPDAAGHHYNLGNALVRAGAIDEAVVAFRTATRLRPEMVAAHFNLGNALITADMPQAAADAYLTAKALDPAFPSLLTNLGTAYIHQKLSEPAIEMWRAALELDPLDARAHNNLGSVLAEQGSHEEAVSHLKSAVAIDTNNPETWTNYARALYGAGDRKTAADACGQALHLAENHFHALCLMGNCQTDIGQHDAAIGCYERAILIQPAHAEVLKNLAAARARAGRIDAALDALDQLEPDAATLGMRGFCFQSAGRVSEAIEATRHATELNPTDPTLGSNLLMLLNYDPAADSAAMRMAAEGWAQTYATEKPARPSTWNHARPRIGFVSGDMWSHPVGRMLDALLSRLDRQQFEIYLYANSTADDAVTSSLKARADQWRSIAVKSDADAAELVRSDEIDILFDLAGHTAGNRLGVFAHGPAPVQASWLGYFNTTGLPTMDRILGDMATIPTAEEDAYTERPARLPSLYLFQPPAEAVEVETLPANTTGHVTFGCFNNPAKINDETIRRWCQVLGQVPNSRIVLNRAPLSSASVARRFRETFAKYGVAPERVLLLSTVGHEAFLRAHGSIDIGLDTFPFNGGTTLLEALYMGVPVVTKPANRFVGHMGESIYAALGGEGFVAADDDAYVEMAVRLATDLTRLSEIRENLRPRLLDSRLCNAEAYAEAFAHCLVSMLTETRSAASSD